ncbi:MAG TPA: hypothetical protein VNO55_23210 [Polyangia bacterium]|nr:hypothetical protein [Polyangia bacterium]
MAGRVCSPALGLLALGCGACALVLGACGGGAGAPGSGGADGAAGQAGGSGGAIGGASGATGSGGAAGGDGGSAVDAAGSPPDAPSETAAPDVPAGETTAMCTPCTDYAPATLTGSVQDATLNQLSGIAVSHRNPGVLFVHNDHTATVFWALSPTGALLATFNYTGVTVRDVEDIAVGSCPGGTCVYLADIGGNLAPRPDYTIVRVPEPVVATAGGTAAPASVAAEKLVFTYPDGALHNAESLLIDPRSGTLYIIDKVNAGMHSTAYRLPAGFGGGPVVAVKIGELPVPMANDTPATAADAHPCGTGFILRTNNTAYEFRIAATAPFEDAFKATPIAVPVGQEQQGEGVSYQPDGRGFYTTTEGNTPPIHHMACR